MTATCFACQHPRELTATLPRGELNAGQPICAECEAVVKGLHKLPPLAKGAAIKILQGEEE